MNGRRTVIGLSLLSAVVLCAIAAPGAQAGTTAFTCAPVLGKPDTRGFTDEHCNNAITGSLVKFEHKEIPVDEPTAYVATNDKTKNFTQEHTPVVLTGTISKVATEIQCTKVTTTGIMKNYTISTVMFVQALAGTVTEECAVPKPSGKCKVKGGEISSKESVVSTEEGEEMALEFTPEEGKKAFAEITLEGSECPIKGTHSLGGTAIGRPSGATVQFSSKESSLTLAGNPASLSTLVTWGLDALGNPIAFTPTNP